MDHCRVRGLLALLSDEVQQRGRCDIAVDEGALSIGSDYYHVWLSAGEASTCKNGHRIEHQESGDNPVFPGGLSCEVRPDCGRRCGLSRWAHVFSAHGLGELCGGGPPEPCRDC